MIAPLFSQERLVMARQRKILSLKMNYGPGPSKYILNSFKYENVQSTKQQIKVWTSRQSKLRASFSGGGHHRPHPAKMLELKTRKSSDWAATAGPAGLVESIGNSGGIQNLV